MEKIAIYPSPVGNILIGYRDHRVTQIKRVKDGRSAGGDRSDFSDGIMAQLDEYFEGERQSFDMEFELHGTEFQKRVWWALYDIPFGETRSYKQIAEAIDNPKACRAVGMANNRNPISIVIPCHRVIGADGKMVGYGGGLDMKEFLLRLEGCK